MISPIKFVISEGTVKREGPVASTSGSGIPAGGITRDDVNDPAGLASVRSALYLEDSNNQDVSVSWAPSASDHSYEITAALVAGQTGYRQLIGRQGSNFSNVLVNMADGTVILRHNSIDLVTAPAGSLNIDGMPQKVRADVTATSGSISVDGVEVASGTFTSVPWSSSASGIRFGTVSGGTLACNGLLSDALLYDPNDDTNTALYPFDGDFTNTHPGSAVSDANDGSGLGPRQFAQALSNTPGNPLLPIPETGVVRSMVQDPAGLAGVRKAAKFNGSAVASFSFSATTAAVTYEFSYQVSGYTTEWLFGRDNSAFVRLRTIDDGSAQFYVGGTLVDIPSLIVADGSGHRYKFVLGVNTQDIYVDEMLVHSDTATFSHGTGTGTIYIGSDNSNTVDGSTGIMWDFVVTDADPTKSAYYRLGAQKSGGGFENEYRTGGAFDQSSTVADTLVAGFIAPATVLGNSGGAPVAAKESWLHYLTGGLQSKLDAATKYLVNFNSIEVDESGSCSTGTSPFTAPADGVAVIEAGFAIDPNSDGVDDASLQFQVGGVNYAAISFEAGSVAERTVVTAIRPLAMDEGDVLKIEITGIGTGTTFALRDPYVSIDFRPS